MQKSDSHGERVWVVPRATIETHLGHGVHGFVRADLEDFIRLAESEGFFMERAQAEADETHLQIIPYLLLERLGEFFVVTRLQTQGEARLHGKVSLGIGGHLNPGDGTPPFWRGMERELEEEMGLRLQMERLEPLGLIRDDSTAVGRVHCGVAYCLHLDSGVQVAISETDKMEGGWATPAALRVLHARMETWSQLLYDHCVASSPVAPEPTRPSQDR